MSQSGPWLFGTINVIRESGNGWAVRICHSISRQNVCVFAFQETDIRDERSWVCVKCEIPDGQPFGATVNTVRCAARGSALRDARLC